MGTPLGSSVKLKQMTSDTIHTSYQGVILWPQILARRKLFRLHRTNKQFQR